MFLRAFHALLLSATGATLWEYGATGIQPAFAWIFVLLPFVWIINVYSADNREFANRLSTAALEVCAWLFTPALAPGDAGVWGFPHVVWLFNRGALLDLPHIFDGPFIAFDAWVWAPRVLLVCVVILVAITLIAWTGGSFEPGHLDGGDELLNLAPNTFSDGVADVGSGVLEDGRFEAVEACLQSLQLSNERLAETVASLTSRVKLLETHLLDPVTAIPKIDTPDESDADAEAAMDAFLARLTSTPG